MLLYTMLYIVHAYLMLFAALTNSVCLNNASFLSFFLNIFCQGYELSGEIALKNNQYYYYLLIVCYQQCIKEIGNISVSLLLLPFSSQSVTL